MSALPRKADSLERKQSVSAYFENARFREKPRVPERVTVMSALPPKNSLRLAPCPLSARSRRDRGPRRRLDKRYQAFVRKATIHLLPLC
jgi:hypothetical protein